MYVNLCEVFAVQIGGLCWVDLVHCIRDAGHFVCLFGRKRLDNSMDFEEGK